MPESYNFIKKETLAHVFSCEFCEIFKNAFLYRTPPMAASQIHNCFWQVFVHKCRFVISDILSFKSACFSSTTLEIFAN